MDEQRLIALEQRVIELEQELENQRKVFNDCTENLISDIKHISKYFNLTIPELITAIQVLRREF